LLESSVEHKRFIIEHRRENTVEGIDKAQKIIVERLAELRAEVARLEKAAQALGGHRVTPQRTTRRAPASTGTSKTSGRRRRAKRMKPEERQAELLAVVKRDGPISQSEAARRLKVSAPYINSLAKVTKGVRKDPKTKALVKT
jgi:ClpP class serine protease